MIQENIRSIFLEYPEVIYGFTDLAYSAYADTYASALVFAVPYGEQLTIETYTEEKFEKGICDARMIVEKIGTQLKEMLDEYGVKYHIPPVAQNKEKSVKRSITSLKKNRDFQKVYQEGKSFANKYLVMYILENGTQNNYLGISVSKKVGNSIVRHRITRLIRESYRLHKEEFQSGYHIVIIARTGAKGKAYQEIESAVIHLGKLHHIWKEIL